MARARPIRVCCVDMPPLEQMGRYHPQERHWYLPFIGVDPLHQGKGYGAALMQHALIPCDRDHTLAYRIVQSKEHSAL